MFRPCLNSRIVALFLRLAVSFYFSFPYFSESAKLCGVESCWELIIDGLTVFNHHLINLGFTVQILICIYKLSDLT